MQVRNNEWEEGTMAAGKNYKVVLIEVSDKKRNDSKEHELHITIELDDWRQKETIGVGGVSVFDEKGNHIERLKYEDGNTHLSYPLGGAEKYRDKIFRLPMSEAAYNQAKAEATITMIVREDGKEYREKLPMKDGMYSWKRNNQ